MHRLKLEKKINAIEKYFNLSINSASNDIQLPTPDAYDDEFVVLGNPLEVISLKEALRNCEEFEDNVNLNQLGIYKRMSDNIYFRWM